MIGLVKAINLQKSILGILNENDEFTIAVITDSDIPELEDKLVGDLESLGYETVLNKTQNITTDIFIDDFSQDLKTMKQSLYFGGKDNKNIISSL